MEQGTKKPWLSRTLWVNALVAILAIAFPPAQQWIVNNPDFVIAGFAGLNMVLRLITKDKIQIQE